MYDWNTNSANYTNNSLDADDEDLADFINQPSASSARSASKRLSFSVLIQPLRRKEFELRKIGFWCAKEEFGKA